MQKYYFLLCCLCSIFKVDAQSIEVDLENKYWNYRDRLKKNFVQIGPEPGQSITAAQLLEFSSPSDTLQYQNGVLKKVDPKTYKNKMVFGDVLVDQGYYLAVLSSEINILTLEGKQNTERYNAACIELFWAIHAIDRLDDKAENYLKYSNQGIKNGFLIRSDNDENFLSRVSPLKKLDPQRVDFLNSGGANGPAIKFKDSSNGFVSGVFDYEDYKINSANPRDDGEGISWIKGANWNGTTYNYGNEMSQDQVYGLLMGFMCVKQWTSPTLSIDPDGPKTVYTSKNIHTWIAEITARIMNHISKDFKHKVFAGDVSNEFEKLKSESCDEIIKKPYWCDTIQLTTPDTFYYALYDDTGAFVNYDTAIVYFRDSIRTSSVSFPGAKLRDCNLWQQAVEAYDEKKFRISIFKESNYIITNPVRDNKIVTRGHLAVPFADTSINN